MSWYKEAQEEPIDFNPNVEPANPLDGMTPAQAKRTLNNLIPHDQIKGFFDDDSWQGIQQIWNAFNEAGVNWGISDSQYSSDPNSNPNGKTWTVEVAFTDKRGKPSQVYGNVRAAGAGSVENPLARYDVVAYFL